MYLSSPSRPWGGGAIAKRFYPSNLFKAEQAHSFYYSVSAMTYDIGGQTVAVISGYAARSETSLGADADITLPSGIRPSAEQAIVGYTIEGTKPDTFRSPKIVTIGTTSIKLGVIFNISTNSAAVQFEGVYLVD